MLAGDPGRAGQPLHRRTASVVGCVLAAIAAAGAAILALLRPQVALDHAQIVMGSESGALYVRVGDTWHPVLNLASARLIAATDTNPQPVRESQLSRTKRGPLLGIPGAPQLVGPPLSGDESVWTICDSSAAATTILIGRTGGSSIRRLAPERAILVADSPGSPAYLLYNGQRALVDRADPAVLRALRLEGRAPHIVSQSLLKAVPEAPPITAPRIRDAGALPTNKVAGLPRIPVGSVLRIKRGDGDEYYVVLAAGLQRVGRVAADLLRFSNSQGTAEFTTVAPDAIRSTPIVDALPLGGFPDRAPGDGGPDSTDTTVCVAWAAAMGGHGDVAFLAGGGLPLSVGQAPVRLSQADGHGPALDGVYLPPARSAYVQDGGARYLVTDTGVRFAIHDDEAAHDLGLPATAIPAPWSMLAMLPCGPELSRRNASVARDTVAGPHWPAP